MSGTHLLSFLALACAFTFGVLAGPPPTLHYELQSQLPPVARVNQTWIWPLLPDTFLSNVPMSYAALDMPDWLTFNANTLTFSGQPTRDDVGNNYVVVQANASDSAVGTRSGFHLLVLANDQAPRIGTPLVTQLRNGHAVYSSSTLQSDGSIRINPRWSFSIGFQQYTFVDPENRPLYYSAVRTDTTSLPNWLSFDNETVTFDGLAPSNTHSFDIDVIASDVYGYGDVRQTLSIIIGEHSFLLNTPLPPINATAREAISYVVPTSALSLDGSTVSTQNLSSVDVNLGNNLSYLSYDPETRLISGSLPSELPSTDDIHIPVIFTDAFNDTINTNITLHIIPQLFSEALLPNINITAGRYFNDDLTAFLSSSDSAYTASFLPANSTSWLTFDNATKHLAGTPPLDGEDVLVNITAVDTASAITESATFTLLYSKAAGQLQKGGGGLSNGAKIALAVVFGIIGGLILLALIIFIARKYCGAEDGVDDDATMMAAAAEQKKQDEKEKARSQAATPVSTARLSSSSSDSSRMSQAVAAAEMSVAAALAIEKKEPKRMDLMRVFGGGKRDSSRNLNSTPSARSIKEFLGLGGPRSMNVAGVGAVGQNNSSAPRRHDIIVVTDGDGYTYRPGTPQDPHVQAPPPAAIRVGDFDQEQNGSQEQLPQHNGLVGSRSEGDRSSWDSQQSSSLFYSEENGSSVGSPLSRPRSARLREQHGTPRSIPRQRKDFQPYSRPLGALPPKTASSLGHESSSNNHEVSPSPSGGTNDSLPQGGIRLVGPTLTRTSVSTNSGESSGGHAHMDDDIYNHVMADDDDAGQYGDYHPALVADAAIATAHLEQLTVEGRSTRGSSSIRSSDSRSYNSAASRPVSRPRLIPFTSERRGQRSDSPPEGRRFPSQKGISARAQQSPDVSMEGTPVDENAPKMYLVDSSREEENDTAILDESTQDAEDQSGDTGTGEFDEFEYSQRYSTISTPYHPDPEGQTTTPIFYPSSGSDLAQQPQQVRGRVAAPPSPLRHSQNYDESDGQVIPPAPKSRSNSVASRRSRAGTIALEPFRIQLGAGEPFHFTASINPPPQASIGSPGRDGPARSTYSAFTDYPDEPEFDGHTLPDWLHFDPRELEFWGIPRSVDTGSIAIKVVERKSFPNTPGSPTRDSRGRQESSAGEEHEQIVGRFVLDVTDRRTVGSLGSVQAITY